MSLVKMYVLPKAHWDEAERWQYNEVQKLLRILRKVGYRPTKRLLAIARHPENDEFHEAIEDAVYAMGVEVKWEPGVRAGKVDWSRGRWVLRHWKPGTEAGTGKAIPY